jgi:hypothetical protein
MYGVDELNAFLNGLPDLDQSTLLALSVRPTIDEEKSLRNARRTARRVATVAGLIDDLDSLRGQIVTWSGANGARSGIWAPDLASSDVLLADIRRGAAQAILDAATATLLGDALDLHSREVLVERWESVRE